MAILHLNVYILVIMVSFIITMQCEEIATRDRGLTSKTIVIKEDEGVSSSNSALQKSVTPFYNLTNKFLGFIQPLAAEGELEIINVFNIISGDNGTNIEFSKVQKNWLKVLKRYLGYVILLAIGVLFIVVMPFVGLIFCFCRCCGHCGGYVKPMERKRARCRRVVYAFILGSLATVMLAGVVVMFITNDLLHKSLVSKNGGVAPLLNDSLNKSASFFLALSNKVSENVDSKVGVISSRVEEKVKESVNVMSQTFLNATNITSSVQKANETISALKTVSQALRIINNEKSTYYAQLTQIKAEILSLLGTKQEGEFRFVDLQLYLETKMSVEYVRGTENLSALQFALVGEMVARNMVAVVDSSVASLEGNLSLVARSMDNMASIALEAMRNESQALLNALKNRSVTSALVNQVQKVLLLIANCFTRLSVELNSAQITSLASPSSDVTLQSALKEYDMYRVYGFIGLGCLCLLIILLFYLGLCFGLCGEAPYEDAGWCNRGVGANLLMAGVAFAFLFAWLLMLVSMLLFFNGGPAYTEACRYLTNDTAPIADGHVLLDKALARLRGAWGGSQQLPANLVSGVLNDCQRDDSSLLRIFKLHDLMKQSSLGSSIVNTKIKDMATRLQASSSLLTKDVTSFINLLTADLMVVDQRLTALSQVSFQSSIDELGVVVSSLDRVQKNVERVIDSLSPTAEPTRIHVRQLLFNMTRRVTQVSGVSRLLRLQFENLKSPSWIGGVQRLFDNSNSLLASPSDQMKQATDAGSQHLTSAVTELTRDIVNNLLSGSDNCRSLSLAMHSIVNLVCKDLLNNFNCLWCGLGCFVLLIIPAIIVAVKLNNLYRKVEKYMKDYEEPDYMAYQGFYPGDNIPLERSQRPTGSAKVKRTDSSNRGIASGGGSSSGATGASNRNKSSYKPLPSYPYQDSYE